MTDCDDTLEERWRVVGLVVLLLPLGLILSSCEDPPKPGKPVLQIHGTKPPSIDLALRIRYVATTEQRQCQQYDMGIPGYKPIEPTWHVWSHEPPSKKPDRRYRVVPMDTTGSPPDSLEGQDLEPFRWTVNAGWAGNPTGCDFKPKYAELEFIYSPKKATVRKYTDNMYVNINKKECNYKEDLGGARNIKNVECERVGLGRKDSSYRDLECRSENSAFIEYCPKQDPGKNISINVKIYYKNRKTFRRSDL